MVNFNRKRLQVFVSSTFSDLIYERQAAVEAILTAGHIPAGMELFTSGDESQMDVIKQWIDESDIFLLILGGRYGSVEKKTRKSYIQLEYEYAVSKNKPLFACVVTDTAIENRVKMHGTANLETDNPQKLKQFRANVLSRMVRFWEDAKDIKISIGETLSNFARRDDLTGWVRTTEEINIPILTDEIARLSKENALLRRQVATQTLEPMMHGLTFTEAHKILDAKNLLESFIRYGRELGAKEDIDPSLDRKDIYDQLMQLGFVDASFGVNDIGIPWTKYKLTNEGRIFLNKLQLQQLSDGTELD